MRVPVRNTGTEEQFVPTADPAVSVQPHTQQELPARRTWLSAARALWSRRVRLPRAIGFGLCFLIAIPLVGALPQGVAASASPNCGGWTSLTRPPDSIRVLRRQSGRVEVVPFRKYVLTVLGKEWPGYLPKAVIEAGAVAVKQYAWFHALAGGGQRVTRDGRCFDVRDGTGDQLYKPAKARIRNDHYSALNATWSVSLRKGGNFFMTGYRRGDKANCGSDATGWKLFARSATRCANRGYSWRQILRTYYGPGLVLVGDSGGPNNSSITAASSDLTGVQPVSTAATSDSTSVTPDATAEPSASPGTSAQPMVDDRSSSITWSSDWQRPWMDTLRASTVDLK